MSRRSWVPPLLKLILALYAAMLGVTSNNIRNLARLQYKDFVRRAQARRVEESERLDRLRRIRAKERELALLRVETKSSALGEFFSFIYLCLYCSTFFIFAPLFLCLFTNFFLLLSVPSPLSSILYTEWSIF